MARNNRNGGNRGNRGQNNNPEGRNQYSSGVMDMYRERPLTTALGAAAAVGAGVFLWSRRNQISDQLTTISDQLLEWKDSIASSNGSEDDFGTDALITSGATGSSANLGTKSRKAKKGRSQSQIAEEAMTLKETGANA